MKAKYRLLWKQLVKYFCILLIFFFGYLGITLIWEIDAKMRIYLFVISGLVVLALSIFDILSARDVISYFQK